MTANKPVTKKPSQPPMDFFSKNLHSDNILNNNATRSNNPNNSIKLNNINTTVSSETTLVDSLHSPKAQTQQQFSNLLKSMSNSNFANFKPREIKYQKPKGCSLISSIELGKILSRDNPKDNDLLILDTRPFSDRSKSFIIDSLHICLPSTLLRRKNFTFEKLIESLPILEQKIVLERIKNPKVKIILYDNTINQTDDSISLSISGIATKILNYPAFEENVSPIHDSKNIILILESGFTQFQSLFPEFISSYQPELQATLNSNINVTHNNKLPNNNNYDVPLYTGAFTNPNQHFNDFSTLTPPLTTTNLNYSDNVSSDSPLSSSSPISALFKFQLPTSKATSTQVFKFSHNEEMMNLESYLSAVNISEESQRLHLYSNLNSESNSSSPSAATNLHNFQFPKRSTPTKRGFSDNQDKLNVQLEYDDILKRYPENEFNHRIPKWFQKLMTRPKIQFIAQYQKLDILEKKRLNSSITKNIIIPKSRNHKQTGSEINFTLSNDNKTQKRSQSQPNIQLVTRKQSWLKNLDSEGEEDDNDQIIISSGVELGNKNRYKDIFPYEHTRVHLKKMSTDSGSYMTSSSTISEEDEFQNDDDNISNNYINANYLHLPELDLTETPPINNASIKVRYIATQAPMFSTVHDFYTCIINDNIPLILSLTNDIENGIEKCFKYWQERSYDGIKVALLEEKNISETICLRRIKLTYENGTKAYEVLQAQLKSWPDLGVLQDPIDLIQLINLKNIIIQRLNDQTNDKFNSLISFPPTVLVHCSAGCGRTGTWCTIDSILSNLNTFNFLQNYYHSETSAYDPVSWIINTFRKQRISMVQNINQFLFVYDSLLYYFTLLMNDDLEASNQPPIKFNSKSKYSNITLHSLFEKLNDEIIINNFITSKCSMKSGERNNNE